MRVSSHYRTWVFIGLSGVGDSKYISTLGYQLYLRDNSPNGVITYSNPHTPDNTPTRYADGWALGDVFCCTGRGYGVDL